MNKKEICSLGGKIKGKQEREKALEKYYKNPNICKYCGKVIEVKEGEKVSEVKRKIFCNKSCSAKFNSLTRKKKRYCIICGNEINSTRAKYCDKCRKDNNNKSGKKIHSTKKIDLITEKGYFKARSYIQKNARKIFLDSDKPKQCYICGYSTYIEVCHVKSVADFSNDALISEINNINNLIALCPNHHKEYDNGLLKL